MSLILDPCIGSRIETLNHLLIWLFTLHCQDKYYFVHTVSLCCNLMQKLHIRHFIQVSCFPRNFSLLAQISFHSKHMYLPDTSTRSNMICISHKTLSQVMHTNKKFIPRLPKIIEPRSVSYQRHLWVHFPMLIGRDVEVMVALLCSLDQTLYITVWGSKSQFLEVYGQCHREGNVCRVHTCWNWCWSYSNNMFVVWQSWCNISLNKSCVPSRERNV